MNKWIEILLGIVLIVVPILIVTLVPTFYNWGLAAIEFLKGGIVIFVVLIGLIFLILGISDLKE
ncbi:MAG: hypothetical protein N3G19_02310 [Candidatus Pacearchaeota archaeon]|nr:hypothetical protein [Candidatus Pacearchaeota archaeon]